MSLADLGLDIGELVRFQGASDRRWRDGVVMRQERDGSVGLRDERGRARAIPIERIEVRRVGPRGGELWVALGDVASHDHQLGLF
ncbi:MAG: hypothetical protein JWM05_2614 [Acidimicrobiales bacterium]|nr:hypothetical protein [Acidimicrobiales bacterium]